MHQPQPEKRERGPDANGTAPLEKTENQPFQYSDGARTSQAAPKLKADLISAGVPPDLDLDVRAGAIITHDDSGLFDFDDETGRYAVLLAGNPNWSNDPDWQVDDVIAFHVGHPERWWTLRGSAFLNFEAVERAEFFSEPLRVYPNPLSWMMASGAGTVVLDWTANLRWWLTGLTRIECGSIELRDRLAFVLREPRPPQIVLAPSAVRRAA